MKAFKTIIIILFFHSCQNSEKENLIAEPNKMADKAINQEQYSELKADSAKEVFKEFRDDLYTGNIEKLKSFCDFPIKGRNNELWTLAYDGSDEIYEKTKGDIMPFPEDEFIKKQTKIFPKEFIKCLLKIKTDELFSKGSYETLKIKEGKTTYYVSATFDKAARTLNIGFHGDEEIWSDDGNGNRIKEEGEFSVDYEFIYNKENELKFTNVGLAG